MAREVTKAELYGNNNDGLPIRFTVADGTAITKGTYMKLSSDPRTILASTGTGDTFMGFAAEDKEASDGQTSIAVWTQGIFECVASGAIILGQKVKTAVPGNYVMAITAADSATASYAVIVGVCLETAADGETVNILRTGVN